MPNVGLWTALNVSLFVASVIMLLTSIRQQQSPPGLEAEPPGSGLSPKHPTVDLGESAGHLKDLLTVMVERAPDIVDKLSSDVREAKEGFVQEGGARDHLAATRQHLEGALRLGDDFQGVDAEQQLREYFSGLAESLPPLLDTIEGDFTNLRSDSYAARMRAQDDINYARDELDAGMRRIGVRRDGGS